jgi:hypothetical protein
MQGDETMNKHAKSTFEIKSWDEKTWDGKPWNEVPGAKRTHAITTKTYKGDIEGEGTSQSLTVYRDDGSASYVGLEHVVGKLNGRSGSFVLQTVGAYENGVAKSTSVVVPGSATGELQGLCGEASFAAGHQEQYSFSLDYDFE